MKKVLKECSLLIILCIFLIFIVVFKCLKEDDSIKTITLNTLPTNETRLVDDSIWCPTFQLIWNDLKNKIIGQDIVFNNDSDNSFAKELNRESFNENMISDEYYYKNYGYMTKELKEIIEKDLQEKFNEKSDILDSFNFSEKSREYFLYSMLYRKFTFKNPFDILSKKTFGISDNSDSKLYDNVRVLFYEDSNNYALSLLTNEHDEVILYKGARGKTFHDTYKIIVDKTSPDVSKFSFDDRLTISNMNFNTNRTYDEITGKVFMDISGNEFYISRAIQTVSFKLDNTGGRVKSESAMAVKMMAVRVNRHFDFTSDYVLFLKEESRDEPYLGINVTNIKNFQ